ncbi:MAG: tRNA (cytosine(32)/uridine(32)-2'-O)-methyltransferase TrmJ [Gammaproteobacteria bacterium RIFCSPHIGHO2_12_FULL_38_14]|nr:MAG: tRNA (cytosine(32)/uridine(32)-2'-O)-methyltransferase TrmJ [Gammaproteobacteria bacterium RIFCSPHIGHO2_12_FULL_38_14]
MLNRIRIVLVQTSHPGNIGAAARAMKTMGLKHLYLVSPLEFPHQKAVEMASGANDVLEQAIVVRTLQEAIADCSLIVGTSTRMRRIPWPLFALRDAVDEIAKQPSGSIAILFGREQTGLTNDELEHCHLHLHIPANASYSSLNIAAAVQVVAYELRVKSLVDESIMVMDEPSATADEMENLFTHLERTFIKVQFLKPHAPRKLMTRFRRLFYKARLDKMEVNMLRGFLTAIDESVEE